MLDLRKATYVELIDLLNAQTASYITMLRTRPPEEQFIRCKLLLKKIQDEIESRISKGTNQLDSTSSSFTQQDNPL
jgi:hypothetical protein